jgi:hypothetical protein
MMTKWVFAYVFELLQDSESEQVFAHAGAVPLPEVYGKQLSDTIPISFM